MPRYARQPDQFVLKDVQQDAHQDDAQSQAGHQQGIGQAALHPAEGVQDGAQPVGGLLFRALAAVGHGVDHGAAGRSAAPGPGVPQEGPPGHQHQEVQRVAYRPHHHVQHPVQAPDDRAINPFLQADHPDANIVAIDYDPGASEVNQLNRIKLMLSTAQKKLKK